MRKNTDKLMKVTILCSGFGLGFYTPGLLLQAGLRRLGVDTAIHVFENVLPESARLKVDKSRKAYHDNFAVALMSQKVPQDMRNSLDLAAMEVLLNQWIEEDRRYFICLSGHWMYVLEEYRKRREPKSVHVDIVYMDSTPSPSWKNLAKHNPRFADGCGETTFLKMITIESATILMYRPWSMYRLKHGNPAYSYMAAVGGWAPTATRLDGWKKRAGSWTCCCMIRINRMNSGTVYAIFRWTRSGGHGSEMKPESIHFHLSER